MKKCKTHIQTEEQTCCKQTSHKASKCQGHEKQKKTSELLQITRDE